MKKLCLIILSFIILCGCTSQNKKEKKSEETKTTQTKVDQLTMLSVKKQNIVDGQGNEFVIKGVSTHGLAWYPQYVTKETFQTLKDDYGVNTIRLAMYTAESGGYCSDGNQAQLEKLIDDGVTYTKQLHMYCIIDWHILSDGNPLFYQDQAKAFFKKINQKYKNEKHILYEICNEPNGNTTWNDIKSYANEIIPVIRKECQNIIIVGTPTWSQDVDQAAVDPLPYDNVVYALHYYAATHQDDLRKKLEEAAKKIPVMVSEFGICEASGNGRIDTDSANQWISLLDNYKIGRVMWNLSNKNEASAILKSDCQSLSHFSQDELSPSGLWLYNTYNQLADNEKKEVKKELGVTVTAQENWVSENQSFQKYSCSILNTKEDVSSWQITLTFEDSVEISDSWNCHIEIKGHSILVTPVDYNASVKVNQTVNDIGLIIKSQKEIVLKQYKIEGV